jgi:hypothetical protein
MPKLKILMPLFFFSTSVFSQPPYWQQQVNYVIDVSLNDKEHSLDGFEKMTYKNQSPDTLTFIWIHLWMNAFKNDRTAFSEQQLLQGNTKFYFSKPSERGYINRLNFQALNKTLQTEDHPNYIDIIKLYLPEPLLPNTSVAITTPFHIQLPLNFSRGGHVQQRYQVTQWFPKPAVYDQQGWHPMPYLDQGEFYSDFGNYEVNITLPKNYKVAATGVLQNNEEKNWLLTEAGKEQYPLQKKPVAKKTAGQKMTASTVPESSAEIKTLSFKQENVIDFAWFADKEFIYKTDTVRLPGGQTVQCQIFYHHNEKAGWSKALDAIHKSIIIRSRLLGTYPFSTATVVSCTMGFSGGMEYPTISSITANSQSPEEVNSIIDHEIGHNWNQGIIANNERDFPWMDEGMNSYYDRRSKEAFSVSKTTIKPTRRKPKLISNPFAEGNIKSYQLPDLFNKGQPINTSSAKFSVINYNAVAYEKTADWLKLMEQRIGRNSFDQSMQEYFSKWKFKHPYPKDFDAVFAKYPVYKDSLQKLRETTGLLTDAVKTKKAGLLPLLGINNYDGLLLGIGVHNYKVYKTNFRFFVAPLYAVKSKKLNGLGRIVYNHYPGKGPERIDIGVAFSKFGMDAFEGDLGNFYLGFTKIAPFIRFTFKKRLELSPVDQFVQFKHFNITEDILQFKTVENPPVDTFTVASKEKQNYYINQFQFSIRKNAALYPYRLQFQAEQNQDLLRYTVTAEQFFNYNEKEGLEIRIFAGKISYLKPKTQVKQYRNDRYALNLLGPKGYEDYTYSTYFYGRNEFEKFSSRQILQRDGFFKFRTDLLASKPGRTDNWIASTNLTSTIPSGINPLSILPVTIPLKLFLDIGTYAEAWKKNSPDVKFLYDAGLQLSLFKGSVAIYMPLIYSKLFTDYSLQMNGKKRSLKNISFSINLNGFSLQKIFPQINF